MKKAVVLLLALIMVFSFIGCATQKVEEVPAKEKIPQVIGADGIPRPDWVYKGRKAEDKHYEVGYSDPMVSRSTTMKKADAEAKNLIAEWVSTTVTEVITTYVNDSGEQNNRQALDVYESLSVQIAQATLSGTEKEDFWVDQNGGVYALVSIPKGILEQNFADGTEIVNSEFYENEAAQAANEKMREALQRTLYGN